ncbi:Aconitate hydratase 3 mitochondrial [Zea mays]|uniref:Aconitate hydratase 3 mitochondrial n=1 Tax=Zea mays TaxID=4577 RepID=A0A1D6MSV9_MAIZE|nr:Aconitate hydratase 3 mitochondrial [Zea mays]
MGQPTNVQRQSPLFPHFSAHTCAAAAEHLLDPNSIRAQAPSAGDGSRIARRPPHVPEATTGTTRPRGATRHLRRNAPSSGARRHRGSGTRCRHRGTLARSSGRSEANGHGFAWCGWIQVEWEVIGWCHYY